VDYQSPPRFDYLSKCPEMATHLHDSIHIIRGNPIRVGELEWGGTKRTVEIILVDPTRRGDASTLAKDGGLDCR
jgi:hypothetical protein